MPPVVDDRDLLADYVRSRSSDALSQLIHHHIDFVYAAALRQTRDSATAEDVTQAVFIVFAEKAARIPPAHLAGWLFKTTRYCAANARRAERRRRRHEQFAAKPETQMPSDISPDDDRIQQLLPLLDDALAKLRPSDREVLLLRYLQGRPFADLADLLGISAAAARKRLNRALVRLRARFAVSAGSPAIVAGVLDAASHQSPAHLASLALSAAAGQIAPTVAVADIVRHATYMMARAKAALVILTIGIAAAAAIVVAAVGITTNIVNTNAVRGAAPAAPASQPALAALSGPATNPSNAFLVQMPNGYSVELLGITSCAGPTPQSWQPDGKLLPRPLPLPSGLAATKPTRGQYDTLWRIIPTAPIVQKDVATIFTISTPGGSLAESQPPTADHLWHFPIVIPDHRKTTVIGAGVSADDWTTIAHTEKPAFGSDIEDLIAQRALPAAGITPATQTTLGVKVSVRTPYEKSLVRDTLPQLLVHTRNGNAVAQDLGWQLIQDGQQDVGERTWLIPDRSVADITSIEYQTRDYDSVTFANVSLDPGQITAVKVRHIFTDPKGK